MTVEEETRQPRGPIPAPLERTVAVAGHTQDGDPVDRGHARILHREEITRDAMMTILEKEAGIEIGIGTIDLIETGKISGREVIRLMMIETNVVGLRVEFRLDALNALHIDMYIK